MPYATAMQTEQIRRALKTPVDIIEKYLDITIPEESYHGWFYCASHNNKEEYALLTRATIYAIIAYDHVDIGDNNIKNLEARRLADGNADDNAVRDCRITADIIMEYIY